jgi:hypothetical protein
MFDDIKKEPDDIFSESDKTAPQVAAPSDQPPVLTQTASSPVAERAGMAHAKGSFPWKAILLVVGILVVVGAAFYISLQILSSKTPVTPEPPADEVEEGEQETVDSRQGEGQEEQAAGDSSQDEEQEEKVSTADRDKDGLTDEEEEELGTSARAADTDGDGLFDLEEVKTWETDPLNPDTDGDTYLDGAEVSGGYNPSGEGTLREPPTESD